MLGFANSRFVPEVEGKCDGYGAMIDESEAMMMIKRVWENCIV